jgi:hypothetical protein
MLKAFQHLRLLFESAPLPLVELLILELTPRHRHASVRVQAFKGRVIYLYFHLLISVCPKTNQVYIYGDENI